jgi:hypothetical protein
MSQGDPSLLGGHVQSDGLDYGMVLASEGREKAAGR